MISTGSGVSEPDSSDEEASERSRYRVEIVPAPMEEAAPAPAPATAPHDRRKMFAKSKSMKNCFSMPAPVGSGYCDCLLLHMTQLAACPIFVVSGIIVMCFRLKYPFLARYCQATASPRPAQARQTFAINK